MPTDYSGDDTAWVEQVPVPVRADDVSEAVMTPTFQALADRAAFLRRVRSRAFAFARQGGPGSPVWARASGTASRSDRATAYVDVPDCEIGDVVHVVARLSYRFGSESNPPGRIEVVAIANAGGGTVYGVPGARAIFNNNFLTAFNGVVLTTTLQGALTVAVAGTLRVCLEAQGTSLNVDDLTFVATRYPVEVPPPLPPTLSAINYSQVDVLGGGADLVLTGTNLEDASLVEVGTGGTWTAGTITGAAGASVSFQAPAKAAGTYDVRVTTPGGTATLSSVLEAWSPSTASGCTLFVEAPNYAVAGGTGTWTARVGTNPAQATSPPAASDGAPFFAANGFLDGAALSGILSTFSGTVFAVANPTNTDAVTETASPNNNPQILTNATNGTVGLSFGNLSGVPGFVFHMNDGFAYRGKHAPATAGVMHAVAGRFTSTSLDIRVDGGAAASASPSPTAPWSTSGGNARIGGQAGGTSVLTSTVRAVVGYNVSITDATATKLYKWAQQRHGVA